ncbi:MULTISPECIES: STAS domain-containing protein [Pseudomonas]|jgi:anti-anti-sigma regulatory factor|uniref:STAS domain-containing protein n=1 Tax=Pseudomonas mosselii TaxID=78327 RepID=A0A5R8YYN7_9PSED|nr:STAS domain-containing protein [Pseudomonas mosselii]TLP58235.1 STAS domain-containing protein [Pseudomonas mosselii]
MAHLTLHPADTDAPARLCLEGDLTIFEARDTHAALLALLAEQQGPWSLDLSALGEVDSAGLQLLLALAKSLGGESQPLPVVALTPEVGALLELLRPHELLIPSQRSACAG